MKQMRNFTCGGVQLEYDVIIIGAGASGLTAAIAAAREGSSVLVIEQMDKAGKKILATGNGKCNYTNLHQSPDCYRSDDSAFAMKVLSCFDVEKTLQFFKELGIYPRERDGYLYPNSEQAASVVSVLMLECLALKVEFRYEEKVISIKNPDFTVITKKDETEKGNKVKNSNIKNLNSQNLNSNNASLKTYSYKAEKLIIATGGCASPKLGSDGSGFELAKLFGHTVIKPLPALVSLLSPQKYCKTVSGVRVKAKVTAFTEEFHKGNENATKLLGTEKGEIVFTDIGISGIPIMQVSRFVAKALDQGEKVSLELDYFAELSKQELANLIKQRINKSPHKTIEEMMIGLLNHKLSYVLLQQAELDLTKNCLPMTNSEIDRLVSSLKEHQMAVNATNSFEFAQVSTGGVKTSEVDPRSMESRLQKKLYLVGELLDVDGTCGGYNLQWAWSSGYLAGITAGAKNKSQ